MPNPSFEQQGPFQCIEHVQGWLGAVEESQQDLKLAGEPEAKRQGEPGIVGAEAGRESQATGG